MERRKITVRDLLKKKGKEKIIMLTSYDYNLAKLSDEGGVDAILVGDSLGMVELGYDSTLKVGMNEIIIHVKSVSRAKPKALVVADMPFGSYEWDVKVGMRNAIRLVKAGAEAVKIEGGEEIFGLIKALNDNGIPVMGHIGLTPQKVNKIGGYRILGKREEEKDEIIRDAIEVERAGAFSVVLENVYSEIAKEVTERLKIPTICIGSGPDCDGQVLVIHDLLGLSENKPYFAKSYLDLRNLILEAIKQYSKEVKNGLFPSPEHYRSLKKD